MKKSNRFLLVTSLFCTLILCCSSIAISAQQVKIPYVVSDGTWWTGIAITNQSGDAIDNMKIFYITATGEDGRWVTPVRLAIPGPIDPGIIRRWIPYETMLPTIGGKAILVNTVNGLYEGDDDKILPSSPGSIILEHPGNEKFSVTVYIGSGVGFAFQVFESTNP